MCYGLQVEIHVEHNKISVYNNGDGMFIEIHKEEGVYVLGMIFGHLLTNSNYNDAGKKIRRSKRLWSKVSQYLFHRI
jgi:DNA gyrase/topoisomerase IV subunit B